MILERLARLGYASIGVVYIVVGLLAAGAAVGWGGRTGDQSDAAAFILRQPFGRYVLAVMALGLVGYAVWRLVSGVADSERRGSDAKGLAVRAGSVFRGLIYAAFALEVVRLLARRGGGSGRGSEAQTDHWTARVMDAPFGRALVVAAGLGVVAYGAYQLYSALQSKLSKKLRLGTIDPRVRRKVVAISRFGIAARGVVFFVIGGSLVIAALRNTPSAAHGTSGALEALPAPLLAGIGAGLAAYGVYALVNARYRRIES